MTASVIVPTYNRAGLIAEAINSVLSQTYVDVEVVIVDDGSTDDTERVAGELVRSDPNRVQYVSRGHKGCAAARNEGVRASRGNLIAFLDSDDWYGRRKLEIETALLAANPHAGFVYSDAIEYDDEARAAWLNPVAAAGRPQHFAREHFMTDRARSGSILYRRECFDAVGGFDEKLGHTEDTDFLQRVALRFAGVYSDYPGLRVRHHAGSKSRQRARLRRAQLVSCQSILADPHNRSQLGRLGQLRITQIKLSLATALIEERHPLEAARTLFSCAPRLVAPALLAHWSTARRMPSARIDYGDLGG